MEQSVNSDNTSNIAKEDREKYKRHKNFSV